MFTITTVHRVRVHLPWIPTGFLVLRLHREVPLQTHFGCNACFIFECHGAPVNGTAFLP